MRKISFLLIFILTVMSLFAQNKKLPIVVITPFDVCEQVEKDERDELYSAFHNFLFMTKRVKVVDRDSLDKSMEEINFQNSEWSDKEKVAALGKAANANIVITEKISDAFDVYSLTINMIDVNTTVIVASVEAEADDVETLYYKLDDISQALIVNMDVTSTAKPKILSYKKEDLKTAKAAVIVSTSTSAATTTTTIPVKIVYKDRVEYKDKIVYRDKIEYRDRPAKNSIKYPGGFAALLSLGITCFVSSAIFMIASGAYDAYYLYDIFENSNRVSKVYTYRFPIGDGDKQKDSQDIDDVLYKYRWPAFLGIGLGGGLPFFVAGIIFTACTAATIERNKLAVDHNRPISRKKRTIAFLKRTAIDGGYNFASDEVTVGMTVKI